MSEHTKGPWKVNGAFIFSNVRAAAICRVPQIRTRPTLKEIKEVLANRTLIAATPDLLNALKAAEIALVNCIPVVPYKGDGPLVNIRKVIAKAEGKSPS